MSARLFHLFSAAVGVLALAGHAAAVTPPEATAHPALWPSAHSPAALTDPATEARIDRLMAQMTLEEKVGQVIQADISAITPEDLKTYPLGSLLAGGNSAPNGDNRAPAAAWVSLIKAYREAAAARVTSGHSPIPLIFGIDAVHGHNKILGATVFPHNVGLGAAHDPDLIERIGAATAEEVAASGADWTFGPTLATPQDVHWGRSYEGYSEDPARVAAYAGRMTLGLQGALRPGAALASDRIASSAKHFLADGGSQGGADQGDARLSEHELIRDHAQGYPPAIDAGILTVMASFSSWNGVKNTANPTLLTDVLKGRMGFDGFVVGDWNAHGQLPGCTTTDCPAALLAGLDMYMAPDSWKGLYASTLAEARSGAIPAARLDDAVRRVLRVKFKIGLFQTPPRGAPGLDRIGAPEHRAIAREAVRKSLVLLKNNGGLLPIRPGAHVLIAGDGADDIGKQSGGWTLNWQGRGNKNADFPDGRSIGAALLEAVRAVGGAADISPEGRWSHRPDVAVVVFGEDPYAEFQGDITTLEYQPGDKRDLALLRRLKAEGVPVVAVFLSGRPLWVNPEINASDAFVAAWLPGTEGSGVSDVLVAGHNGRPRFDFTGRLSYSWPKRADATPGHVSEPGYDPQFPLGYGLSYAAPSQLGQLSEDGGKRVQALNVERYFTQGRAQAPWALSYKGAVTSRPIDAGAQENALRLTFSGDSRFAVWGQSVDLSRQATGEMAVRFRYRVVSAPDAPVLLGLSCGERCGAAVDVTGLLKPADGAWREWKIKLSCFRSGGADLSRVDAPFILTTGGRLTVEFTQVGLVANEGDAQCPTAPPPK